MAGKTKRVRRTGDAVRTLILDAAREIFSKRGYAGATTREIAVHAKVGEVLLFRHFKSKAQLFEQAVFNPMDQYIREFQDYHLGRGDADPGGIPETRDFVAGLIALLSKNRHLLMALIAVESYESEVNAGLKASPALKDYFESAEDYLKINRHRYLVDLPLSVRLSFATALAAVLFEDWLFAGLPPRLDTKTFVDQLTLYMLGGLEGSHGLPPARLDERNGKGSPKPKHKSRKSRE